MSIQPQFESHRYVGEICKLQGQAVVECRLPGSEISSILAVQATASPTEASCFDGEVRCGGKATLCIVYEDGDKKICRAERGVEFFHKAEGSLVTPACFAKVGYKTENISWRREGSGLYITVIVGGEISVFGGKQMEYLSGGEELACKKGSITLAKTVCVSGETEGEDEFDCDYVGDVLLHSENAVVHRAVASAGQMDIEGEIALHLCVLLGDDGLRSYEKLIPFRMQIPCDEAFGSVTASARVRVHSAHLSVATDEEKGVSKMVLSYALAADCFLHIEEELPLLLDAFSLQKEVKMERVKERARHLSRTVRLSERVAGIPSLSQEIDGEWSLQATVLPRAEISCRKGAAGIEIEGVISAEILLTNGEGSHRAVNLSLPFLTTVEGEEEYATCEGIVCGLNLRREKSGHVEAEGTVKLLLCAYEEREWEYISALSEGEDYKKEESGFSVFMTEAGEELWSVAKRLRCTPESLRQNNPDLDFPLKKSERIFVYRQI